MPRSRKHPRADPILEKKCFDLTKIRFKFFDHLPSLPDKTGFSQRKGGEKEQRGSAEGISRDARTRDRKQGLKDEAALPYKAGSAHTKLMKDEKETELTDAYQNRTPGGFPRRPDSRTAAQRLFQFAERPSTKRRASLRWRTHRFPQLFVAGRTLPLAAGLLPLLPLV